MLAEELKEALRQAHSGSPTSKPNPAAVALRLGLHLRPVVGAMYSFDGHVITYDAMQPLERQREHIARACVVHLMQSRMRETPAATLTDAVRQAFELE